jgi:hypothetical protein
MSGQGKARESTSRSVRIQELTEILAIRSGQTQARTVGRFPDFVNELCHIEIPNRFRSRPGPCMKYMHIRSIAAACGFDPSEGRVS